MIFCYKAQKEMSKNNDDEDFEPEKDVHNDDGDSNASEQQETVSAENEEEKKTFALYWRVVTD